MDTWGYFCYTISQEKDKLFMISAKNMLFQPTFKLPTVDLEMFSCMLKEEISPFRVRLERIILRCEYFFGKKTNFFLESDIVIVTSGEVSDFSKIQDISKRYFCENILVLNRYPKNNMIVLGQELDNVFYIPNRVEILSFNPNFCNEKKIYFYIEVDRNIHFNIDGLKKINLPKRFESLCLMSKKIIYL